MEDIYIRIEKQVVHKDSYELACKNTKIIEYLPILCRISENFPIYIIELHKTGPFEWLRLKKSKTCIWLTPSYVPATI